MFLAFVATDRSHYSSDRAKTQVKVERIGIGNGAEKMWAAELGMASGNRPNKENSLVILERGRNEVS